MKEYAEIYGIIFYGMEVLAMPWPGVRALLQLQVVQLSSLKRRLKSDSFLLSHTHEENVCHCAMEMQNLATSPQFGVLTYQYDFFPFDVLPPFPVFLWVCV